MTALSPLLLLKSPLGDDTQPLQEGTLHAIQMVASEQISRPFEIVLHAVSTNRDIDPATLLRQPVTITVRRRDGLDRLFNGVVRQVDQIGMAQRARAEYRLEIVPRLWFLEQTIDCRIFQRRSAVEILQTLFSEGGVAPVEFRIFGDQPVREYTTQYDETSLRFAHRIMQESGYFYFFEHSDNDHTLVVTDANQAFSPLARPLHRVIYNGDNVDIIDRWAPSLATTSDLVRLQDYDPTRPDNPVIGQQATTSPAKGAPPHDVFLWPAMTIENPIAADRARFRMEAAEAWAALGTGHGFDPAFCPGLRFTLATEPSSGEENVDYAIYATRHVAADETWIGGTTPPSFDTGFQCFRQSTSWRDDLSIPRPHMAGIFSAIVLGEPGEEIHTESLGRVKVRPLFDYRKETTASAAIWVRVLHAWSGNGWGWQHVPRVGREVGLSFMNGDPDNPVVVGSFYNGDDMPPFPLPAQQTKQGFRSRSTLRGNTEQYNELSFDDRKGDELILMHAQKDHRIEVEHDQTAIIGQDRSVTTTRNDSLTSQTGEISITAEAGAISITAATSITLRVGGSTITITDGAITINSAGAVATEALGDVTLSALGLISAEAVGDLNLSAVGLISAEAVGDVNIAGSAVTIEAADGAVVCIPFPI